MGKLELFPPRFPKPALVSTSHPGGQTTPRPLLIQPQPCSPDTARQQPSLSSGASHPVSLARLVIQNRWLQGRGWKGNQMRRGAARHADLWVTLPQTDLLAPEQSTLQHTMDHGLRRTRDTCQRFFPSHNCFGATAAALCLQGPVSSLQAVLEGRDVLDLIELGALAARRPP